MMKNIEWGAVAYLSHSKYGKNSEVYINNSEGYYTGRSGGNVGGKTAIKDVYTDQTSMYEYNQYGFYTYDGYLLKYGTNEKSTTRSLNKVASTTGNIYGIYDMSGGTFESLMANIQDESDNFYPDSAATWSTADVPLDKYYDKYSCEESGNGDFSYGKLGDATIEMQPDADNDITWYDDYALFPAAGSHWFYRGANYDRGYDAGLFSVVGDIGAASDSIGARTVLSILP